MNLSIKIKDNQDMRIVSCKDKTTKRNFGGVIFKNKLSSNEELLNKTNKLVCLLLNF